MATAIITRSTYRESQHKRKIEDLAESQSNWESSSSKIAISHDDLGEVPGGISPLEPGTVEAGVLRPCQSQSTLTRIPMDQPVKESQVPPVPRIEWYKPRLIEVPIQRPNK